MTQPASRKGPVLAGSPERFGDSRQGVAELLGNIQDSARGSAEWIDGQATGGGTAPPAAHDHRGGVWGRPLGVGHSMPMRESDLDLFGAQRYETTFFLNVPDTASPSGNPVESLQANGGYQFATVHVYAAPAAGSYEFVFEASTWQARRWTTPQVTRITYTHPGGAIAWATLGEGLALPPGLVRVRITSVLSFSGWEWSALTVPH